jgi:hypothetical protein
MTTNLTTTTTTTWAGAVHTTLPRTWRRPAVVTLDPVESELDDGAHHDDERIVFTGQVAGGHADARVWVRVDDAPWARADRVVLGEWVYTTPGALPAGRHAIHVRSTDAAGVPLASAAHEFGVLPRAEAGPDAR